MTFHEDLLKKNRNLMCKCDELEVEQLRKNRVDRFIHLYPQWTANHIKDIPYAYSSVIFPFWREKGTRIHPKITLHGYENICTNFHIYIILK